MAKTVSPVFKFSGTIDEVTHVNSHRYAPHVRAKKYSKTPFVMPAALAESKERLQSCNQYLRPIFQVLRLDTYDGTLWSRLLSSQFASLKAGRPLGLECLVGLECNLQHKLGDVFKGGYDFSATVLQNELLVRVILGMHPAVNDELLRTGYQIRVVAIFPDAAGGTAHKTEVLGPLTAYDAVLEAVELRVPVAVGGDGCCMLVLGMVPHVRGEGATRIMSDVGMKVVWAGRVGVR